jgi:hypothetical protein
MEPVKQSEAPEVTGDSMGGPSTSVLVQPRVERRRVSRNLDTPPVPPSPPHLDDYQSIVGAADVDELRFLARDLRGKSVKMVNSTAVGGGVAEILNRLVPLLGNLKFRPTGK